MEDHGLIIYQGLSRVLMRQYIVLPASLPMNYSMEPQK